MRPSPLTNPSWKYVPCRELLSLEETVENEEFIEWIDNKTLEEVFTTCPSGYWLAKLVYKVCIAVDSKGERANDYSWRNRVGNGNSTPARLLGRNLLLAARNTLKAAAIAANDTEILDLIAADNVRTLVPLRSLFEAPPKSQLSLSKGYRPLHRVPDHRQTSEFIEFHANILGNSRWKQYGDSQEHKRAYTLHSIMFAYKTYTHVILPFNWLSRYDSACCEPASTLDTYAADAIREQLPFKQFCASVGNYLNKYNKPIESSENESERY